MIPSVLSDLHASGEKSEAVDADVQLFIDVHGQCPALLEMLEEDTREWPAELRWKVRELINNAWVGGYNERMDEEKP